MAGLLAAVDAQNGLDIGGHRLIMTPGQVAVAQSEVGDIGFRQTLETEQSVAGKHGLDELVDLTILPRPRFLLSERFLAQRIVAFDKPVVLQIGRASCRERVCQYVEISVVAGSLKKKKKKKK